MNKVDTQIFLPPRLEMDVPSQTFYFEGGLVSLVQFYNENFKPASAYLSVEKAAEESRSVVALQYADDISSRIVALQTT